MKPTTNDKLIAYLALFSGLAISGIAEYYSIMGLIAIYPAAFWPIVVMGVVLGVGKITGTIWLKQNWEFAPFFLKVYILPAILVLMMITSLGVFGFLSKAHSDQSLVSGDVQSKISVYDEKIRTAKENIDANRKALKQMDEAVDQVMGRSTDEKGADKAVAIRRGQQKERARLQAEITAEQKLISQLSEERAPIAAEVRKVEAEVGPLKYIAHLLYGENPDANVLEKAVIWVSVLIVIVLDPLAVVLLLASQYSFQRFRKPEEDEYLLHDTVPPYVADVGEKPTEAEKAEIEEDFLFPTYEEITHKEGDSPQAPDIVSTATVTEPAPHHPDTHPYLREGFKYPPGWMFVSPMVAKPEIEKKPDPVEIDAWNKMLEEAEKAIEQEVKVTQTEEGTVVEDSAGTTVIPAINDPLGNYERPGDYLSTSTYVQNEEQQEENTLWKEISSVSETQYLQTARQHQVSNLAEQVIAGVMTINQMAVDIRSEVAAEIEKIKNVDEKARYDQMVVSLAQQVRSGLIDFERVPENLQKDVRLKLDAE